MSTSRYVDTASTIQVIGNIYNNITLLDNDNYTFIEDDFPEEFHRIIFGTMYNLHELGAKKITINAIEDYLVQRPKAYAIYQSNKGKEYLEQVSQNVTISTFGYYYQRLKKMTLLRMYDSVGLDLTWLYDIDNIFDVKRKQVQEDWLDNTSLESIAETINNRIDEIKIKYVDNTNEDFSPAGKGITDLIESFQTRPEYGYPLYGGSIINSITRGARLKKFYLRSAATGVGKTRAMIADACTVACNEIFDSAQGKWVENGSKEPVLYITTEQELDEIQTMMLAFLSNVDENHIIYNEYYAGEFERVMHAAEVLSKSELHIKRLPDFSIKDIENTIKFSCHEYKVKYVFFDYLHTSMKILTEVTSKTGIKGLREDNVLFMISIRLKDICNEYGIFIMTSTQLNAEYKEAQIYDQNLLRGAKSIADKIDLGMIMLETSNDDREALKSILTKKGYQDPVIKISIYKNRRGQYKNILLWCKANRGTCRIEPMFATDYNYHLIEIEELKINIKEVTTPAF